MSHRGVQAFASATSFQLKNDTVNSAANVADISDVSNVPKLFLYGSCSQADGCIR